MDIGMFPGGVLSSAAAVNDHGLVVGTAQTEVDVSCQPDPCTETHAFSFRYRAPDDAGPLTDLGTLGGTSSYAYAVSDSGWIAGASDIDGDAAIHAFRYDPATGEMDDLGTLGGTNSWAYGVNDHGWVVGRSQITGNSTSHAFVYDPHTGVMHDLGTGPSTSPGATSVAHDINNCGAIVGQAFGRAFRTEPTRFDDVGLDHRFARDVCWLVGGGATDGYLDGTFRPATELTRQAFVGWLYGLAGRPAGPLSPAPFSDIGPAHPFADAIAWAADQGLVAGYADGTFRPAAAMSRQALVVWLHRAAGSPSGPSPVMPFSDVPSDHPFATAILWAYAHGIAAGYADGTFRPAAATTRQAAAAFVRRAGSREI
jgi:probable HAF family extracellular repeat protein